MSVHHWTNMGIVRMYRLQLYLRECIIVADGHIMCQFQNLAMWQLTAVCMTWRCCFDITSTHWLIQTMLLCIPMINESFESLNDRRRDETSLCMPPLPWSSPSTCELSCYFVPASTCVAVLVFSIFSFLPQQHQSQTHRQISLPCPPSLHCSSMRGDASSARGCINKYPLTV